MESRQEEASVQIRKEILLDDITKIENFITEIEKERINGQKIFRINGFSYTVTEKSKNEHIKTLNIQKQIFIDEYRELEPEGDSLNWRDVDHSQEKPILPAADIHRQVPMKSRSMSFGGRIETFPTEDYIQRTFSESGIAARCLNDDERASDFTRFRSSSKTSQLLDQINSAAASASRSSEPQIKNAKSINWKILALKILLALVVVACLLLIAALFTNLGTLPILSTITASLTGAAQIGATVAAGVLAVTSAVVVMHPKLNSNVSCFFRCGGDSNDGEDSNTRTAGLGIASSDYK